MENKDKEPDWYQIETDGEKTKFRTGDYEKFEKLARFAMSIDPEMTVKELLDRLDKQKSKNKQ